MGTYRGLNSLAPHHILLKVKEPLKGEAENVVKLTMSSLIGDEGHKQCKTGQHGNNRRHI